MDPRNQLPTRAMSVRGMKAFDALGRKCLAFGCAWVFLTFVPVCAQSDRGSPQSGSTAMPPPLPRNNQAPLEAPIPPPINPSRVLQGYQRTNQQNGGSPQDNQMPNSGYMQNAPIGTLPAPQPLPAQGSSPAMVSVPATSATMMRPPVMQSQSRAPNVPYGGSTSIASRFSPDPYGVSFKDVSLIATPPPITIRKGELINIEVDEQISQNAVSRVNRRRDVQEQLSLNELITLVNGWRLRPDLAIRATNPQIDVQALNNVRNQIQSLRQDNLKLSLQAMVAEVKPNGNLVLEAHGQIEVNNDTHVYSVSGLCDARDINPAKRSIKSSRIASKLVTLRQIGSIRDATKRGFITHLIDMFRPL